MPGARKPQLEKQQTRTRNYFSPRLTDVNYNRLSRLYDG
jgi:hypothetical protein